MGLSPPMTLGRAMLLAALEHETQVQIARRCGVSQQTVSRLIGGHVPDSYRLRVTLRHEVGIPLPAWDQPSNRTARAITQP